MLYMIAMIDGFHSDDTPGRYLVKVGFSNNLDQRLCSYRGMNPGARLIGTCQGTRIEEAMCQETLLRIGWGTSSEWVIIRKEEDFSSLCNHGFDALPCSYKLKGVQYHGLTAPGAVLRVRAKKPIERPTRTRGGKKRKPSEEGWTPEELEETRATLERMWNSLQRD